MRSLRRLLVSATVVFSLLSGTASAAIITFDDRDAWNAAVSGVTTTGFEGLAPMGDRVLYPGGLILDGVQYTASGQLYVVDAAFGGGMYDWGSGASLVSQPTSPSSITIALPIGVTAWGTDLMSISPLGQSLLVTLASGESITVATFFSKRRAFFGVVSDTPGGSVMISGGAATFAIDNFSHASPIPEPGTLVLLGGGLVGLSWLRRRSPRAG